MNTQQRIVILGAGYTGMLAAVRLARRTRKLDVRTTIVNPSARFTERLRMHQIAAGQELADHRISDLLAGSGVEFVQGWVTSIDTVGQRVIVDGTAAMHYDTLIYALGSSTDTSIVPGAADHAFTLNDPRTAHRFSEHLAVVAAKGGNVTVCGGGLTGIEAAAEIADSHPGVRVTLISSSEPGAMMGDKARAYLNQALDRIGVTRKVGVAPDHGAAPQVLSGPHGHQSLVEPAHLGQGDSRNLCRPLASRAAADLAAHRGGDRIGRHRVHRHAGGAGNPEPDRTRHLPAARGIRLFAR
jgi:NADH:ubiquinone reductase (H+-translocating)